MKKRKKYYKYYFNKEERIIIYEEPYSCLFKFVILYLYIDISSISVQVIPYEKLQEKLQENFKYIGKIEIKEHLKLFKLVRTRNVENFKLFYKIIEQKFIKNE